MKAPQAPRLDQRREEEFAAELRERAQAWVQEWALAVGERDFGRALLDIAARFSSEVAERLDAAGDRMRRGFLDWLGVPRKAARPARLPVVFKLVDAAPEAVLAAAPVKMQADAAGVPVMFETEQDVQVVPGRLEIIVGVDADNDAYYLPPPGLSDLQPAESQPTQWRLKSFASTGVTKLQLDPEAGLVAEMLLEANGQQYRIVKSDKDLVTIEPPLMTELAESTSVSKVSTFSPFGGDPSVGQAYNWQEHALYLGDDELLYIEAKSTIEIVGATGLRKGYTWEYWGKAEDSESGWQHLTVAPADQQKPDALILKKETTGEVEPYVIGSTNTKSRWIRAHTKKVDGVTPALRSDALRMGINCITSQSSPLPDLSARGPTPDAMSNTTPLVLDSAFFPLGKEPRQFDAFYLGSQEAFSKKRANVKLDFEMVEPSFATLSSLQINSQSDKYLAGVAADGCLYLLRFAPAAGALTRYRDREGLRPPSPGPAGATIDSPSVTLDQRPKFRAPVWMVGANIYVAVSAKSAVWIWKENTDFPANSGWESAGLVEPVSDPLPPIEGLVFLADAPIGRLFALRKSKLYVRNLNDPNPKWQLVETKTTSGDDIKLEKIAPIWIEDDELGWGTLTGGLIGVDADKRLYGIEFKNAPFEGTCTKLLNDVASDWTPSAVRSVRRGKRLIAVAVNADHSKLRAFLSRPSTFAKQRQDEVELGASSMIGDSIDVNIPSGRRTFGINITSRQLTFVACVKPNVETTALVAWSPFDPDPHAVLFTTEFPAYVETPAGSPTLLPQHIIVPTASSHVLVAPFDQVRRLSRSTILRTALVTTTGAGKLTKKDSVAIPVAATWPTHTLQKDLIGFEYGGTTVYRLDVQSSAGDVFVYPAAVTPFTGTVDPSAVNTLMIDTADTNSIDQPILLITTDKSAELYRVTAFDGTTKIATLDRNLDVNDSANPPTTVSYKVPRSIDAQLLPLIALDQAADGNWSTTLLDRTRIVFLGATPELQIGTVFRDGTSGSPMFVVLSKAWLTAPPVAGDGRVKFLIDGSVGDWVIQLGNAFTNPDLSWEYWNGKGWWKLPITSDNTQNLKTTGAVQFEVPPDIAPSDWAGKTNFWIRARLVGGDYGREKVTARTTSSGNVTEQTIERSSEGIRAPQVLDLYISYSVCDKVPPTYVLAQDSGSFRDQSDANRTPGAIVEAFVPLAETLRRLSNATAPLQTPGDCPPECDNPARQAAAAQLLPGAIALPASEPATARALFIGMTGTRPDAPANVLSGEPVNLLMLVDEREHAPLAPMAIDALAADGFVPIVTDDSTRALGESGLLSMTFANPPTPRELFGQTLTWLRLTPKQGASSADWKPTLRGAYLNAVWASATETMTRELLGSSDGAPNMSVLLARPPVLDHTLELRVKEPLGDEERDTLRKADKASVLNEVDGLPGDWVLWKQVTDPNDEPADARVYALGEATGEIRFGDGRHGRIPPIGRDSIVAFRYQRTEPGPSGSATVPGNLITARTALNLVSPVATVESVTAADQAAGGAPPEDDNRVLRFGYSRLRHRGRAVTLHDLEDLAVQSSPDIVQARAVARRRSTRLVVVMRGRNPAPTAAQVRELRRLLLAAAPVALSAPNALSIEGPKIRWLRIQLKLRVERLHHAGALAQYVNERLTVFFDTATGGIDKDGWALGINPSEDDIAFALIDAPYLESIEEVTLYEIAPGGNEQPWPHALKPTELTLLHTDWLGIQFEIAEVEK